MRLECTPSGLPPLPTKTKYQASQLLVRIRKPGRGVSGSQFKDAVSTGEEHFRLWHIALTLRYLGRWGGSDPERARIKTGSSSRKRRTWQQHTRSGQREPCGWWGPEHSTGKDWCLWGITKAGLRAIRKQSLVSLSLSSCHKVPDGNHRKQHPVPN